jgi:hypothetical protein
MTFKQTTSDVTLANMALGLISEGKTITALDNPGHNPQVIRRWYKPVVARLLEMHHWGLATKRSALVQEAVNLRSSEWLYAYAAPEDMAFPVGMVLANGTSSVSYYRGLAGLIALSYGKPIFQFHNNVIYTNVEGDLEYVSYDITEADFNATFADIVVLMLASRLAREIPKDVDLADELQDKATTAINLAITQNFNTGGQQYGMRTSEAELVRGSTFGDNWDYFPRSPGA